MEVHTTEPLDPALCHLEVEIAIVKLKRNRSAARDQITEEKFETGR
jgi:hypothetical protein